MFSKIKEYIQDQITLAKLEAVERLGKIVATVVFLIALLLFAFFLFTFLCLAGAYFLSVYLGSYTYGFLAMAGVFALLILIFLLFKKGIKGIVINTVICSAMSKNELKRIK